MDHEVWDEFLEAYQALKRENDFLHGVIKETFQYVDTEVVDELKEKIENYGKDFSNR